MDVLIISECWLLLNIFFCGEFLEYEGKMWLYYVNFVNMRSWLVLLVGLCELLLFINYLGIV